jgi:deoxyribonuclease-4
MSLKADAWMGRRGHHHDAWGRIRVRIGCHVSVAGGYAEAVQRAAALGADCFQYFTKSPRMLRFTKKLNLEDAARGRDLAEELNLATVAHAPYLINLAAPSEDLRRASVDALLWDLEVARARGTPAVVVHSGKHVGAGVDAAVAWMRESLQRVMDEDRTGVRVLIENTAGQGTEMGTTPAELLAMVDGVAGPDRLGFCFDTQHAFGAGVLNPTDPSFSWEALRAPEFVARLGAIHLNDSKVEFGHRADRHALVGQGHIGDRGILTLLTEPTWQDLGFYLETPVDDEAQYASEIAHVRQLLAEAR